MAKTLLFLVVSTPPISGLMLIQICNEEVKLISAEQEGGFLILISNFFQELNLVIVYVCIYFVYPKYLNGKQEVDKGFIEED